MTVNYSNIMNAMNVEFDSKMLRHLHEFIVKAVKMRNSPKLCL